MSTTTTTAAVCFRLGLGDDQHNYGYEAELDPWLIGLLETIALLLPNANNPELNTLEHYPLLPPQFCVSEAKTTTVAHDSGPSDRVSSPVQINERVNAMQQRQLYWAEVVGNERLTAANHFQTVHQLRVKLIPKLRSQRTSQRLPLLRLHRFCCYLSYHRLVFRFSSQIDIRNSHSHHTLVLLPAMC